MCLLLLIQNRMLVDGSFIACIYSLLVLKTKMIHFHEEQIRNSQEVYMDKWPWRVHCQEEKSTRRGLFWGLPLIAVTLVTDGATLDK